MSNIPEEARLTDEERRGHFYKVSTSPERFAFTKDDGTLIDPSRHSFVDTKRLADAASEKALKAVGQCLMKLSTLREFHAARVKLIKGEWLE